MSIRHSIVAASLAGSVSLSPSHAVFAQEQAIGERIVAIASDEAGATEVPGPSSNVRVVGYIKAGGGAPLEDSVPWCSYFAMWVAKSAGADIRGATGAARSWLKVGEAVETPGKGDIVVLWRGRPDGQSGHVGFYMGEAGGMVFILGGNQGSPGKVGVAKFPKAQVLGYRHLKA